MPTPKEYVARSGRRTWRVRFRLGSDHTSETFPTLAEAQRFCASLKAHDSRQALKLLLAEREDADAPTVDELSEQHFDWKAGRVTSDRTVADYRRDYRNWIKPTFGPLPAHTVNENAVQQWVDAMASGKLGRALSPKSVADRHALLHGIYAWAGARARGLVEHNPCVGTDLPKRAKSAPKALRPAEWQALDAALRQVDAHAADLAFFLISTGWRWSEATALSAFDVEDDGRAMRVTMGRVVRRNAAGEHVIVEDAKSRAGLRQVKLDRGAADMVRRRLPVHGDVLVFTTARGAQWHYANFLNRIWKPAVKAAGLSRQPTPHWLRHTHVVWMALDGEASLPELQRRIGHESIANHHQRVRARHRGRVRRSP